MKQSRSFTLIELLVVISIIGLLSSIVLVSMKGTRGKARIAKGLEFSQSVNNALGADAVGIWRFEEGVGSTVYDYSGYGNNGTLQNFNFTPSSGWTTGIIGNALSFDGVDDYVDAGSGASTNFVTDDFTIELWIKTTYSANQTLVQRGAKQVRGYTLMADPYVHLLTHQAGTYTYVRSRHTANTGEWQHWVAVKVGTTAKLYLNGVEDLPYTSLSDPMNNPVSAPSDSLKIGSGSWGYANGLIDEVRIYNQALSAFEIQKHYAEGLGKHDNLAVK